MTVKTVKIISVLGIYFQNVNLSKEAIRILIEQVNKEYKEDNSLNVYLCMIIIDGSIICIHLIKMLTVASDLLQ